MWGSQPTIEIGGVFQPRLRRVREVAKMTVTLIFPQNLIREPVVYRMAKQFDVMPNIRRARVTDKIGEMVLELESSQENLEKAIEYLKNAGVTVEPVAGDLIE
jgi:ABC-type methionine transport system ATPase subunit